MSLLAFKVETAPQFAETLAHMQDVRRAQIRRDTPLAGRISLTATQHEAARRSAHLIQDFNKASGFEALHTLLIRFLDMARRNNAAFDLDVYPTMAAILQHEWAMNIAALEVEKNFEKLIPLTLYQGADFATAPHEPRFAAFKGNLGTFRQTAIYYPMNPRKHLRFMVDTIKRLKTDEEFAEFRDTPGLFREAANANTSNPQDFLRRVRTNIERLAADKRFKEFQNTPGLYRRVALHNVNNAEEFLLQAKKTIKKLTNDPELQFFAQTPGIIKHAAISHPGRPRQFLLEILEVADKIRQEKEFKKLDRDHQGIVVFAACYYRRNPRAFLRQYAQTYDELYADPQYESLRSFRWPFKYAAKNTPNDPHGFMSKVLSGEIDAKRRKPGAQSADLEL